MTMIERVARAIYANFYGAPDDQLVTSLGEVVTFDWDPAGLKPRKP